MISKPVKWFAATGLLLIAFFALVPLVIHFARPHVLKDDVDGMRSDQLAIRAQRKQAPTSYLEPTPASPVSIQPELKLAVPFTAQAPTGNWDELHNEACEEASAIMVHAYFSGITSLPPQLVEQEISKLTTWQKDNLGYYLSITTPEMRRMVTDVYDLEASVVPLNEEVIKQSLNENKLVILPANGRLLENPNFRAPGPLYHMLVITGYDKNGFITNDPGTRNGHNYRYDYKTIYAAAGSYSHKTHDVNTAIKELIIVSK